MRDTVSFFVRNPDVLTVILFVFSYLLLSLWKFKRPQSPLGETILKLLIQISVFSLNQWGAKNPRVPLTISAEDAQKELEAMEEKK